MNIKKRITPYAFVAPVILTILAVKFYPILYAFWISFTDFNIATASNDFIGIENYITILTDNYVIESLKNTTQFVVEYVVIVIILGLSLAILTQNIRKRSLSNLLQALCFVPFITSMVAISAIWKWLYQPMYGVLNYFLSFFNIGPYTWLADPKMALNCVIFMTIWKNMGYIMVIYTAGLISIPYEYYEAARIDGANNIQQFRRITIPLLRNVTLFLVITSIIGAYQVFTQTFIMTEGGPGTATRTLVLEVYLRSFQFFRFGEGSAVAFFLFFIILIFTIIQLKFVPSREIGY